MPRAYTRLGSVAIAFAAVGLGGCFSLGPITTQFDPFDQSVGLPRESSADSMPAGRVRVRSARPADPLTSGDPFLEMPSRLDQRSASKADDLNEAENPNGEGWKPHVAR